MDFFRKYDEKCIMNKWFLRYYTAPEDMTFKGMLKLMREDFRPEGVTVTEEADRDTGSYGSEYYEWEYYLSHYEDTRYGRETLCGTTAAGTCVEIGINRSEETEETSIVLMSRDQGAELDQVLAVQ